MDGDLGSGANNVNDGLVRRLVESSELHGEFVLSSGRRSTVYFDKFRFLTRPDLLRELAHEVAGLLPEGTDHLAAPEGAATLLVAAVSLETGLPVAVIRKEAKAYGTLSQVEAGPAGCPLARSHSSLAKVAWFDHRRPVVRSKAAGNPGASRASCSISWPPR